MALQLGALRDALLDAHVDSAKASAAAEEVAGYENRLTRLTTTVQIGIALLLILLGSQAALWLKMGELSGQMGEVRAQLASISSQLAQIAHGLH